MKEKLAIKEAIKRNKKSVNEVAELMGISRFTLSTHINGNPSAEILLRIAEAIGCRVADLFSPESGEQLGSIVCPKCGAKLKIVLDEDEERQE